MSRQAAGFPMPPVAVQYAFELMKMMVEAGAADVHFEDQLASEKKCGHMGGKVLVPASAFIRTLTAARLAADVMDVPTFVIARTDACSASLLTSDVDERDHPFLTGQRTALKNAVYPVPNLYYVRPIGGGRVPLGIRPLAPQAASTNWPCTTHSL